MKTMKLVLVALASAAVSLAQNAPQNPPSQDEPVAVYKVTVTRRAIRAVNYRHRSGSTKIDFKGTLLMPEAKGEAKVEGKQGVTKIQAQFDKLGSPMQFGPEFLTYVMWAISPEGRPTNLGELLLDGNRSKLEVTTELHAFAMLVTAEPHFAPMQPSDVVVLENIVRNDTLGNIEDLEAKYELMPRGEYEKLLGDTSPMTLDPKIPLGLYEARNALRLAQGAKADHYASASFAKAKQSLETAESYQIRKSGKKAVEMTAREAVQTAEDARVISLRRQEEERIATERRLAAERQAKAEADAAEAVRQRQAAEAAKADAERAKLEAQLEAERAARQKMEAEQARQAALADAERQRLASQAEMDRQRAAAQAELDRQRQAAQVEVDRARAAAEEADRLRRQAEADKAEIRSRLMNQLNSILQTRDSVRGLIVNMSDVLFDTGSYTLRPPAREKLAKMSGILLAYPGLTLQVEGHTDSVGGDEYNQTLSEHRASSVRDYLVQEGVGAAAVTSRGFGKTRPVDTNETASGRQANRRVEIVVTGDMIGAAKASADASPAQ